MRRKGKALSVILLSTAIAMVPLISHTHVEREIPRHVHPAVAEAIKKSPEQKVRVIIGAQDVGKTEQVAVALGGTITASWPFIHAFAVDIPAGNIPALAALSGVKMVSQDHAVTLHSILDEGEVGGYRDEGSDVDRSGLLNSYNYAVKADQVWSKGVNGSGVTVAVVDSGISIVPGSDDVANKVIVSQTFHENSTQETDLIGHGTHVTGIIGGIGTLSNGKYIGIAPGVNVINVKYSADDGEASEQDIINALQWVYDNRETYNIRVVNISSNATVPQSYQESAVSAAVEQLWLSGVVVVVSAGNYGNVECATCYAPASDPYVISVGGIDDKGTRRLDDDTKKSWSSYGQTLDGHMKPDVVAPGSGMVSFMPYGLFRTMAPQNIVGTHYFRMGGTSMAAPVVSGVVAMMLQAHPDWTPDQVKWVLMHTTRSYNDQPTATAGVVDAEQAVFYRSTPDTANQGNSKSPLLDPTSNQIDYSNMSWSNMSWSNMSLSSLLQY